MKKKFFFLGFLIGLLSINFIAATICYQETANVSTACGGLATGSYSKSAANSGNDGYFYINYSIPTFATSSSLWQVKHGRLASYNVSIPIDCFNTNTLSLRMVSHSVNNLGSSNTFASWGQCYNQTVWKNITSISNYTGDIGAYNNNQGVDLLLRMYDGDYATQSYWQDAGTGEQDWYYVGAPGLAECLSEPYCGYNYSNIYEESMIWNMSSCPKNMLGTGSSSNPCQITSWAQLNATRNNMTANYVLMNNLSAYTSDYLSIGSNWVPIGDSGNFFYGDFSGNNNTISNLTINTNKEEDVGLFGWTAGTISDVGIVNANINSTSTAVGALVGTTYGGNIINCYSSGLVKGTWATGGLIGQNLAYVSRSYSIASVIGLGGNSIGGLAGVSSGIINNSYAKGNVNGGMGAAVGGLVGYPFQGHIFNSYATGNVSNGSSIGGLAGALYSANVTNSFSKGFVSGTTDVGGLIGFAEEDSNVINSYWDNQTSGQTTSIGGIGKTTDQMKTLSTFLNWNINYTSSDLNNGYPYLAWQGNNNSYTWLVPRETIKPLINFTNPTQNTGLYLNRNNFLVNVTSTDTNLVNITINLYNSTRNLIRSNTTLTSPNYINYTGLSDGVYYFNATSTDILNNKNSTETRNVTIDITSPTNLTFTASNSPNGANLSQNYIDINVNWSEINFKNVSFLFYNSSGLYDNQQVYSFELKSMQYVVSRDGTYTYNFTVCDLANNCNTSTTRTITLDTHNPNATLISPPNATVNMSSDNINFTANLSDNLGIKNATLNIWNSTTLVNQTTISFAPSTLTSTLGIVVTLVDNAYSWFYKLFDWAGNSYTTQNNTLYKDAGNLSFCHPIDVAGNYYLNQAIVATGDCFEIKANNVVFDCNSFSIKGPGGVTSSTGIFTNGYNNITIQNCNITDFAVQISLINSKNSKIKNILSEYNAVYPYYGIWLDSAVNTTLTNITIRANTVTDFFAISQSGSNNTQIYNSTIINNLGISNEYSYIADHAKNNYNTYIENSNLENLDEYGYNFYIKGSNISTMAMGHVGATASRNNTLLNTTTSTSWATVGTTSTIIKQWYFNINVTYSNGTLITFPKDPRFVIWDKAFSLPPVWNEVSSTGIVSGIINESLFNETSTNGFYFTPHTLNVTVTGYNTNTSTFNLTATQNFNRQVIMYLTDIITPVINIISPVSANYSNVVGINFTATDETALSTCWFNNGTTNTTISCTQNYTVLANNGSNTWRIYANDTAGNKGSAVVTFFVDRANPTSSLISPANNTLTNNASLAFAYNVSDNLGIQNSTVYIYNQSGLFDSSFTSWGGVVSGTVAPIIGIVEGIYNWFVTVFDVVGHSYSTTNRTLTVDTTSNGITIISPTAGGIYPSLPLLNFTLTGTDYSSCFYNLNNGANSTVSCTGTVTLNATEGNNTLNFFVRDNALNLNTTSVKFYYDSPNVTICRALYTNGRYYTIQNNISTTSNCIEIKEDNIILDMNGKKLTGDNSGGDLGISAMYRNNLTIKNGTIDSFGKYANGRGIYFFYSNNSVIRDLTLMNSTGCLDIWGSFNNTIDSLIIKNLENSVYLTKAINNTFINLQTYYASGSLAANSWSEATGNIVLWNNSFGEIKFTPLNSNVIGNLIFDNSGTISINNNSVYLNSTAIPALNKSANITMYGIGNRGFVFPKILKDGRTCTDCTNFTSLTASTVIFNVTGFSNYSIGEDPNYPSLIMTSPINQRAYGNSNVSLNFSAIDDNLDSCWYNLGAANISLPGCLNSSVNLSDGTYVLTLFVNDTQNHVNSTNATFYISTGVPVVNLDYPADGQYKNTQATVFNFTATKTSNNLDTCELWLNGTLNQSITGMTSGQTINFTSINLVEGQYIWNVKCNDSLSLSAFHKNNHTLFIDLTNPNATLISPANGSYVFNQLNYYAYNVSDNMGVLNSTLHISNSTYEWTSSSDWYGALIDTVAPGIALVDGVYNWFVSLFDLAGNYFVTANNTITIASTNITTCEQLQNIKYNTTLNFTLGQDIDCSDTVNWNSGAGFIPFNFSGILNGSGYKISNLYINKTGDAGLIEILSGTVTTLGMENVSITGTANAGSLVGSNNRGSISEVYVTGQITGAGNYVGGISSNDGWAGGTGYISNCWSNATVNGGTYTGGIVGYKLNGNINSCYYTGFLNSSGTKGGIAGSRGTGTISNSFSDATFNDGGLNNGGIVGSGGGMSNCYWNKKAGQTVNCVGFNQATTGCTTLNNNVSYLQYDVYPNRAPFTSWTFYSIWQERINDYPILTFQGLGSSYDITAPTAAGTYPVTNNPNTVIANLTVNLTGTINDSDIGIKNATIYIYNQTALVNESTITYSSSGTLSAPINFVVNLVETTFTWFIELFDFNDNFGRSTNNTFVVDVSAPTIIFNPDSMANNSYFNILSNKIYINMTATDPNFDYMVAQLWDSNGWVTEQTSSDTTANFTFEGLEEKQYYIFVNVVDRALLITQSETRYYNGDLTAPNLTINSPAAITYTTNQIQMNINPSETISSYWYSLNNGVNTSFTNLQNVYFSGGTNILTIYANDTAGNIGNSTQIFHVLFTEQIDINDYINPIAPEIGSNLTLFANVTTDNTLVTECNFTLISPTHTIYNNQKGTGTYLWQSAPYIINESGQYNYTITCMNEYNSTDTVTSNFEVANYTLKINAPFNPFSRSAVYDKYEQQNITFSLYDNVDSVINYTMEVDIENKSNFTLTYPASFLLNNSENSSAPLSFKFIMQLKTGGDVGTYNGNITLTNQFLGTKTIINFTYGINPPSAIPVIYDTNGLLECGDELGETCSIDINFTQGNYRSYTHYLGISGEYSSASNCTIKVTEDLNQPWITYPTSVFDLTSRAVGSPFTLYFAPTTSNSVASEYTGEVIVYCNQTNAFGNPSGSFNSIPIRIRVQSAVTIIPGGGGGTATFPEVNVTNITAGFCGNRVCERQSPYNETYSTCAIDCPGDLSPLTDCLGGLNNGQCIILKGTAFIYIVIFMALISLFLIFAEKKKKTTSFSYKPRFKIK